MGGQSSADPIQSEQLRNGSGVGGVRGMPGMPGPWLLDARHGHHCLRRRGAGRMFGRRGDEMKRLGGVT